MALIGVVAEVQVGGQEHYAILVNVRVIKNARFHSIGCGTGPKKAGI